MIFLGFTMQKYFTDNEDSVPQIMVIVIKYRQSMFSKRVREFPKSGANPRTAVRPISERSERPLLKKAKAIVKSGIGCSSRISLHATKE